MVRVRAFLCGVIVGAGATFSALAWMIGKAILRDGDAEQLGIGPASRAQTERRP